MADGMVAGARRRLGPSRSPVVPGVAARIRNHRRASLALRWGVLCSITMILVLMDMYYRILSAILGFSSVVIWFSEFVALVFLFTAVVYDLTFFLGVSLRKPSLKLTESQKKMLRVEDSDCQTVSTPVPFGEYIHLPETPPSQTLSPITTPSLYFRTPTGSVHSTPSYSYSSAYTPNKSQSSLGPQTTPFSSERITSIDTLDHYLHMEEDREHWVSRGSPDLASLQAQSSWQTGSGSLPRKYRVGSRCLSFAEDEDGREGESIWSKLEISQSDLSHWTDRCRQWLAQTILTPVAEEIKQINETLQTIGCSEISIGSTSLAQLRDLARVRTQQLPSLGMLLRYLNVTSRQSYLVKRIQELAQGGCIGSYHWSATASRDGEQPNDAEIIMHFFCTYMDSQLPPSPQFHDGRTFSEQFLLKTPHKPGNKKADICLYQTSSNPPHFKVIVRESTLEIPKGRYNLFHAIVAFVYQIKTKEQGLLGQYDLTMSTVNLLWIVNSSS